MMTFSLPPSASHPSTNRTVFDLIERFVQPGARLLDFGAGRGHMAARIAGLMAERGGDPGGAICACDLDAGGFSVPGLTCVELAWSGALPWPDNHFDAAYSIEVIEHLTDPYSLAREMLRVVKPGGAVVLTTPNIHHMTSRLSNLLRGYPTMFGVVTFREGDEGDWLNHVTPVVWTTLHSALRRGGADAISLHVDRRKKSAVVLAIIAFPWVAAAVAFYRRALAGADQRRRAAEREFGDAIAKMASFDLLTSRSLVAEAIKAGPGGGKARDGGLSGRAGGRARA